MHWDLVLAIIYVVLLALALLFVAGATRLAKKAEAQDRMRPRWPRAKKKPADPEKHRQGVA